MNNVLLLHIISYILAATASREKLLSAAHGGLKDKVVKRSQASADDFIRALDFKYHLRVCNTYPSEAALQVYRDHTECLTADEPMPFKSCRDFSTTLHFKDELQFRLGDAKAGTFVVSDLPNNDATLLLVIHRHDTSSSAVSFESHIFSKLVNAQLAVIDTYRGITKGFPRITDAATDEEEAENFASRGDRSEELRFDSVVAVNPGRYEVVLEGADSSIKANTTLVVLNRESYVVLRTGVESDGHNGVGYPEEIVVYPQSSPMHLRDGAVSIGLGKPVLILMISGLLLDLTK